MQNKLDKNHTFIFFHIFIYKQIIMGRKKITEENLKVRLSVTINHKLYNIVNETIINKSKYVEWLIEQDLNNKLKNS